MIKLISGDTGAQIKVEITADDGVTPIDLNNTATVLRLRARGSSALVGGVPLINRNNDEEQLTLGIAVFALAPIMTGLPIGRYEGEVEITATDTGDIQTVYEVIGFMVREDF